MQLSSTEQIQREILKEAQLYKKLRDKRVQCLACSRYCIIENNSLGFCRVRKNIDGKLYSLVYGRPVAIAIDPIEKKPLYHFKPATSCTSISTLGCNFACLHCQNWNISQEFTEQQIFELPYKAPEEIISFTVENNLPGISYTYTEPTIFFEYALDIMRIAKKKKLYNVWVSNGYMSKELRSLIAKDLDAINIDIKGSDKFYKEVCGNASLKPVLENIEFFYRKGIFVELTYLVVPHYNDKAKDIKQAVEFIASIDKEIPLHITRFFPHYKLNYIEPTPITALNKAKEIAKNAGLKYVYLGNIAAEQDTYCANCNALLIERNLFEVKFVNLNKNGKCKKCGYKLNAVL
ncbi:MAG: AmmeMemoRadiSam system radical SAM enzyme [Candidatus Diapherotrites archaeon]|nr:AmmeMemoRadiSam system radical SAM enzyme [Candidatus Diapherotrites archaeon]